VAYNNQLLHFLPGVHFYILYSLEMEPIVINKVTYAKNGVVAK